MTSLYAAAPTEEERWEVWCGQYEARDRRTRARMTWVAGLFAAAIAAWLLLAMR